jgi:hypothetical protein
VTRVLETDAEQKFSMREFAGADRHLGAAERVKSDK